MELDFFIGIKTAKKYFDENLLQIWKIIDRDCKAASFVDFSCGLETSTMATNKQVTNNRKGNIINLVVV